MTYTLWERWDNNGYGGEHNDLVLAGAVAVWFAEVRGDLPPAPGPEP